MTKSVRALLAFLLVIMTTLPALAQIRQVKIEVTGLYCPSCPYTVAQSLKAVPSVKIVGGNYDAEKQTAVSELLYDDSATSVGDILDAPEMYGYHSQLLEGGAS